MINKKQQIEILNSAKDIILSSPKSCLCDTLSNVINAYGFVGFHANLFNLTNYLPIFNIDNAIKACKEKGVPLPDGFSRFNYWWDINNRESRIAFIDWMIEQ